MLAKTKPTHLGVHLGGLIQQLALDLNDLRKYPALLEILSPRGLPELRYFRALILSTSIIYNNLLCLIKFCTCRQNLSGEIADQQFHLPVVLPKGIGRFYFLFQKPIVTAGREEELRDRKKVGELYRHVKGEVETALQYLQVGNNTLSEVLENYELQISSIPMHILVSLSLSLSLAPSISVCLSV